MKKIVIYLSCLLIVSCYSPDSHLLLIDTSNSKTHLLTEDYSDKFVLAGKNSHIKYNYWHDLYQRMPPKEFIEYFKSLCNSLAQLPQGQILQQKIAGSFDDFCRAHQIEECQLLIKEKQL